MQIDGMEYENIDDGNGGSLGFIDHEHKIGTFLGTPFVKLTDAFIWTPKKYYFTKTFYFRDTMGLPLSFIFDKLELTADEWKHPMSPWLLQFRQDAISAGWSDRKISADIREALGESFGSKRAEELMLDLVSVVFTPRGYNGTRNAH